MINSFNVICFSKSQKVSNFFFFLIFLFFFHIFPIICRLNFLYSFMLEKQRENAVIILKKRDNAALKSGVKG